MNPDTPRTDHPATPPTGLFGHPPDAADPAPHPRSQLEDRAVFAPGHPYCGKCGYALKGLTSSSACPECGTPFVIGLVRGARRLKGGYRFRTAAELWGLPLVHIAFGPDEKSTKGKARGIIAIGDHAYGFIAIGGFAFGGVTIGGISVGVSSIGGCAFGLLSAIGGCAAALGLAIGGLAAGSFAMGGMGVGILARGGQAIGLYTINPLPRGLSKDAAPVFDRFSPIIGHSSSFFDLTPAVIATVLPAGLAALVGLLCVAAYRKFVRSGGML